MGDFDLAVDAYRKSRGSLKVFAKHAARVDGEKTRALAEKCECSVDKVENHRRAYRLYYALGRELETPDIHRMWVDRDVGIFVEAAKIKDKWGLTNAQIYEDMQDGEGMSIEAFRALVNAKYDTRPEWQVRLQTIRKKVDRFYAYIPEMPPDLQVELQKAFDEFGERLERIGNGDFIDGGTL